MTANKFKHQQAQRINYVAGGAEQRARFSSLARCGMFEVKTQRRMTWLWIQIQWSLSKKKLQPL